MSFFSAQRAEPCRYSFAFELLDVTTFAQQAHGRNQHPHAAGLHDLVRVLAVPLVRPVQDRPGRVHVAHVGAEGRVIGERVGEELRRGLEAADHRGRAQHRQQLARLRFGGSDLRPYRVVHLDLHLLLPFDVLMEPFAVIETASPTAMRVKRRAVAWSMGITMTSSPRFKRASAWPSIVLVPWNVSAPSPAVYRECFGISKPFRRFASRSAMYLSAAATPGGVWPTPVPGREIPRRSA